MRDAIHIKAIPASDAYSGEPESLLTIYHAYHYDAVERHNSFSNAAIACISGWVNAGFVVLSDEEAEKEEFGRDVCREKAEELAREAA